MTSVPDYYKVLGVQPTASQQEIRDAYKKSALKTHPDRVSSTDPTRAARTRKFQEVNDAYYTLSDKQRRKDYDEARRYHTPPPKEAPPNQQWQDEQFGGIFEEMLREEGMAAPGEDEAGTGRFYGVLGGISGAALGFIVGNVPGALAGAVAGNRLGAVRDAKGKSVYDVFQQLPQGDKAKILADLATKILSHTLSA
ncbi:dnaJ chaperone-like protein [Peziza echinospora]|nr:dnaJ chaperone-like protein [Peziza echinospora]